MTQQNEPTIAKTHTVAAGERYGAGGLHRLFFGADYRDLWTTPIEAEVLDLARFAGGLAPAFRVGGQQTKGLALRGADGRAYTFRAVDKDPSHILPPELRATIADRIIQDQIASSHPAAALIADPLLAASGVLHVEHRLLVLPDDSALGEFREDFAGVLGTLSEYPQAATESRPGTFGALEIIDGLEMWKRLQAGPQTRVDARAFLRARLVDIFMGDWDRHLKQWRFARMTSSDAWQPIPEDRDQAFARFEGLVLAFARTREPRFVAFGPRYPGVEGLTWNGWDVDRRLLTALELPVWQEVARDLQGRLSDAVIDVAVGHMPAAYAQLEGNRLARALKQRRNALPEVAERFYRHLAHKVTVHATDQPELLRAVHLPDGNLELSLAVLGPEGQPAAEPYYRRRFLRAETREVRVHLEGGADRFVARGRPGGVLLRVVGGRGNDVLDDSQAGGTRLASATGKDTLLRGPGTKVDRRTYAPRPPIARAPWIPHRDWGRRGRWLVWAGGGPDIGAFLGSGFVTESYGFRKLPYGSRQRLRGGWATAARQPRVEYEGDFRRSNSPFHLGLKARASGIDILRFYGFGNSTQDDADDDDAFFRVEQQQFSLAPAFHWSPGRAIQFSVGPIFKYAQTDLDDDRFISQARPYGAGDFGQAGIAAEIRLDSRDRPAAAGRGAFLHLAGTWYPELLDVDETFGRVEGEAAVYVTLGGPRAPTLAVRAGGQRVWGHIPFHEAAFIGGVRTVRGLRPQRYAGEAMLYGSAELRLFLARLFLVLPAELGVFGLADTGRVYVSGENSNTWHTAWGGGLWLAFLNRANTVTFTVARTHGRTRFYVGAGFAF